MSQPQIDPTVVAQLVQAILGQQQAQPAEQPQVQPPNPFAGAQPMMQASVPPRIQPWVRTSDLRISQDPATGETLLRLPNTHLMDEYWKVVRGQPNNFRSAVEAARTNSKTGRTYNSALALSCSRQATNSKGDKFLSGNAFARIGDVWCNMLIQIEFQPDRGGQQAAPTGDVPIEQPVTSDTKADTADATAG